MTEFRQKLVRQPELHQPPWSLLLVPRMTPQANGEERHDLEPTMPRGGISASALGRWCLLSENAFDGSARTCQSWRRNAGERVTRAGEQEHSPIASPGKRHADLGLPVGCLSSWEKEMSKKEWEASSTSLIHADAFLPCHCRRFSTIFLLYLEKKDAVKKPYMVLQCWLGRSGWLIVQWWGWGTVAHMPVTMKTCLSVRCLAWIRHSRPLIKAQYTLLSWA